MALGRGADILRPVEHQLDRSARLDGRQSRMHSRNRRIFLLAAEASARRQLDDTHPVVPPAERLLQAAVDIIGALHRAVNRDALTIIDAQHRLRLDIDMLLVAGAEFIFDYPDCLGDSRIRIAFRVFITDKIRFVAENERIRLFHRASIERIGCSNS